MRRFVIAALAAAVVMPALRADETSPRFDDERLFTTAEQREYLDALRAGSPAPTRPDDGRQEPVVPTEAEQKKAEQEKAEKKPPSISMQGFVRRSDGRSAVWANDQNTLDEQRLADDVRIDSGRIEGTTVVVILPDGRKVRIEPGQVWDSESGEVAESYRR